MFFITIVHIILPHPYEFDLKNHYHQPRSD